MPPSQRTPQQHRALQLLAEAEHLECASDAHAAMKKYQAAYRLDPELEAASFADEQEQAGAEEQRLGAGGNARELATDEIPGFDVADPEWLAFLHEHGLIETPANQLAENSGTSTENDNS